jgi:hypothetical protein
MIVKLHPVYKEAARVIANRVDVEGYGILIKHHEILDVLELVEPTTLTNYKQFSLDRMSLTEKLKEELLEEYNIYIMNKHGEGYVVLTPEEQIEKAPQKHMKKAKREIMRATNSLINVNVSALSTEGEELRLRSLSRLAFISSSVKQNKLLADK